MRIVAHRLPFFAAVVFLVLALIACSPSSTSSSTPEPTATPLPPTATPVPMASIVRVTKSKHFADSMSGGTKAPCASGDPLISGDCGVTLSSTCASGDTVVSGGFTVDDELAFVSSSYPSDAATWTVTAHDEGQDGGSHPVTLTVYADCLHANFSTDVSVISATPGVPADGNAHEASVDCPAETIVTGGGFRGTNGTQESIPAANGWTSALSVQFKGTAKPQIFALCAKNHLTAASKPKELQHALLGGGADLNVSCPAATLLVGGGMQTVNFGNITTSSANAALTMWHMHVSANGVVGGPPSSYTVTDYAICVKVS